MRFTRVLVVAALLVFAASSATGIGVPTVRLTASRFAALNDGRDFTEIVAEVRDGTGSFMPDGTMVTFTTSLGQFAPGPSAGTRAGAARVRLSSIQKGTAIVTATVQGGGFEKLDTITFTDDPADTVQGNAFISMQATAVLLYSAGDRVAEATGRRDVDPTSGGLPGARLAYRNIEITADHLQLDCTSNAVRANGHVRLARGTRKVECSRLYYPLLSGDGFAIGEFDKRIKLTRLHGANLSVVPPESATPPALFEMVDLSEAPLVITSRHLVVFPGEKLQFTRPRFYQQGQQLFSLPFYSMGLFQTELFTDQFVSVGSQGLGVDVPVYYDLTPSSTGIFRIRNGERSGRSIYATRPGWSLDLTQAYNSPGTASRMSGEAGFTGINRSDWGFRWTHSQEFAGATRGSLFLDVPQHRAVYGSANLNRPLGPMQLGLNFSGNRSLSGQTTSGSEADLYLEMLPRKVARTGYMMTIGGTATASRTVFGPYKTSMLSQGVQARFFSSPFKLDRQTSITNYVSLGNVWTNAGASGLSVLASVSANHTFGPGMNMQMSYDLTRQPVTLPGYGMHRVSGNFTASAGTKWNLYVYGSKLLDVSGDSLMADVSYAPARMWRLALQATYQRFSLTSFSDVELGIGRSLGGRDFMISYSTFNHRFYFDLQASRF